MIRHSRSLFISRAGRRVGFVSVSLLNIALVVSLPASSAQIEAQQRGWAATGSLATGRFGHTSTLLADGKVLVAGGRICTGSSCTEFDSAELYDPTTGLWTAAGHMSVPRHAHVAVRLPSGKVLVAGGFSGSTTWNTAELYDPETGSWSLTGSLSVPRAFATATVLANGKVLVAGGGLFGINDPGLNTAELYDPAIGDWTSAGTMTAHRRIHTATLLADGRVLIASGMGGTFGNPVMLNGSDIYDPATGSWTPTGRLATGRVFHTATLLQDGRVLVTGGSNFISIIYDTAEIYDPAIGQWRSAGSMSIARNSHTATVRADGKVLVVGGFNNRASDFTNSSAEQYEPASGSWTVTADLNIARGNHAATLLADGRVLVSGGNGGGSSAHNSAELFTSTTTILQITGASVSGKILFVEGQNFDEGAKVYLNDEKQKTANETATTMLRCKKAGRLIERGATVRLKVRNTDGTESAEFTYTRPVE
jgi:N-acetylneuraminic acid mutarotase